MAEYWDTSLDKYSEENTNEKGNYAMDIDQLRSEAQHDDKMNLDNKSTDEMNPEENTKKTPTTYTGHRTDTGRNMYVFLGSTFSFLYQIVGLRPLLECLLLVHL